MSVDIPVIDVCNPHQAKQVLEKHLDVGFFLPCKMVVYEEKILNILPLLIK